MIEIKLKLFNNAEKTKVSISDILLVEITKFIVLCLRFIINGIGGCAGLSLIIYTFNCFL